MLRQTKTKIILYMMAITIVIGFAFLIQLKYGWNVLYGDLQLVRINWLISSDSTNESFYKERIMIYAKYRLHFYNKMINADSLSYVDIQKCIQLGTKDTNIYKAIWLKELGDKNYKKSLDGLNSAIKYGAKFNGIYYLRSDLFAKLGMYDSAIADLKKNLKIGDYSNYYMIGNYYTLLGKYQFALEAYQKDNVYYNSIKLLLLQRKYSDALLISQRTEPEYRLLLYYLLNDKNKALAVSDTILQNDPDNYFVQYCKSKILFEKGDVNNGLLYLTQALQNGFSYFDLIDSDPTFTRYSNNDLFSNTLWYYKRKNAKIFKAFQAIYNNNRISNVEEDSIPKPHNSYWILNRRMYSILLYPNKYNQYQKTFYLLNYNLFHAP